MHFSLVAILALAELRGIPCFKTARICFANVAIHGSLAAVLSIKLWDQSMVCACYRIGARNGESVSLQAGWL